MMGKKFEVVMWKRCEDGCCLCNTIWSGDNKFIAEVIASHYFAREIIKIQCVENQIINAWEVDLDMNYAEKVKCRITILREIDHRKEARGEKPAILKSFGDESIEIFQRIHFD